MRIHEGPHTRREVWQSFAAAWCVVSEVPHPGVDLLAWQLAPRAPFPAAETDFAQGCIDVMPPTPAPQPAADLTTACER